MNRRGLLFFLVGFGGMLAAGWFGFPVLLYRPVEQHVQFSHKVHAVDGGQACEDCHAIRENGSFAGLPTVEMCATCHSSQIGTTIAESLFVANYVSPKREISWAVYMAEPAHAYFPHVRHVKIAQIACERCHGGKGSSENLPPVHINRISGYSRDLRGSYMDDCSGCHRTNGVRESCIDCHQ
jgi:menaquinone reductase, multiheme cytochrome c subunit